ncbi:MAG TPA: hypothetical protein VMB85_14940 [Bryobacteraceae bacterium]|jgi:hypothetical protein|nr:hypothetical protein [Bryobacteraceae bacterium]
MRRLVLTSLLTAAAVFAQSGTTPAPKTQTQKSAKKHHKSSKKSTPATASKSSK